MKLGHRAVDEGGDFSVFDWHERRTTRWRLLAAFVLCLLILSGLLLLFKVSSPPVGRSLDNSYSALILDPASPITQAAWSRAMDRSALILPSESLVGPNLDQPLLPLYRPSFEGFQLRLKELKNNQDPSSLPDYFQPSDIVLSDSLSMRKAPSAEPVAKPLRRAILKAKLKGDLADAEWKTAPDLSPFRPQDVSRLRYLLGVAPNGRVALVVPLLASPEDRLLQTELGKELAKTRFKPRSTKDRQWGEVTFSWVSADIDPP